MNCAKCGGQSFTLSEVESTLVGTIRYKDELGEHSHDDNCLRRMYTCLCGHSVLYSLRRRCSNPRCGWVGKETCFCHKGKKVESW